MASYPLIGPTLLSPANPLLATILETRDKNQPTLSVLCSDYPTLKAILLRSDAWLLAPALYFNEELATGERCKLDIQHPALLIELSVLELNGRSRSPAAQAFIDICQKYLDALII